MFLVEECSRLDSGELRVRLEGWVLRGQWHAHINTVEGCVDAVHRTNERVLYTACRENRKKRNIDLQLAQAAVAALYSGPRRLPFREAAFSPGARANVLYKYGVQARATACARNWEIFQMTTGLQFSLAVEHWFVV